MGSPAGSETTPRVRLSNYQLDQIIGNLLRIGVLLAAIIVIIGGIAFLVRHGSAAVNYRVFESEPEALRSVPGTIGRALTLDSQGIIQLGLLVLIATPIARVVFSLIAFGVQRDGFYMVVTAIVLGILLYSLSGGTP